MYKLIAVLLVVTAVYGYGYKPKRPSACFERKKVGPCEALIPRWFFNSKKLICEPFNFGGCDGNRNNFETLRDCKRTCKPVHQPQEGCFQPLKVGPCRAAIPRWYYNKSKCRCDPFSWGGCNPNKNNLLSLQQCRQTCFPRKRRPSFCLLPSETGPCKAYFKKYFYDVKTGSCLQFIYGGCLGNKNRFDTVEECQKKCRAK